MQSRTMKFARKKDVDLAKNNPGEGRLPLQHRSHSTGNRTRFSRVAEKPEPPFARLRNMSCSRSKPADTLYPPPRLRQCNSARKRGTEPPSERQPLRVR